MTRESVPDTNIGIGANTLACPKPKIPLTTYRPASVAALDEEKAIEHHGHEPTDQVKRSEEPHVTLRVFTTTPGLKQCSWLQTVTPACTELGQDCTPGSATMIKGSD